jgi:hypothetical protein
MKIVLIKERTGEVTVEEAFDPSVSTDYIMQRIEGVRELVEADVARRFHEPFWKADEEDLPLVRFQPRRG